MRRFHLTPVYTDLWRYLIALSAAAILVLFIWPFLIFAITWIGFGSLPAFLVFYAVWAISTSYGTDIEDRPIRRRLRIERRLQTRQGTELALRAKSGEADDS